MSTCVDMKQFMAKSFMALTHISVFDEALAFAFISYDACIFYLELVNVIHRLRTFKKKRAGVT